MSRLADEILMTRPFSLLEEEAVLNLIRTADVLNQEIAELLKPYDLGAAQYNVLRILRGAKDSLRCGEIASRMVSRDPDITRLLDRLEARSLVGRERDTVDRRAVKTRITSKGLALLAELDPLVLDRHRRLASLGERKLKQLINTLEQIRELIQKETT